MSIVPAHGGDKRYYAQQKEAWRAAQRASVLKTANMIYQLVYAKAPQDEIDKRLKQLKALTRH